MEGGVLLLLLRCEAGQAKTIQPAFVNTLVRWEFKNRAVSGVTCTPCSHAYMMGGTDLLWAQQSESQCSWGQRAEQQNVTGQTSSDVTPGH